MADSTFPDDFCSQPETVGHPTGSTEDALPKMLGDYELLDKLGEGGMGVVYLARQRSANRTVALKVIRPANLAGLGPQKQRMLDRFQVEAEAAASLEHNNIVTVYDVGEADGHRYFSMRYVPGSSLADLIHNGPLENQVAAEYMEPVARAVHSAHEHGILHRDIKPQNILIDSDSGAALVADFGLAKLHGNQSELTRAGEVMGTPQFMSPEQAKDSGRVTAQSDVYSLGATLYNLLTGRPVFQAATPLETLRQVLDEDPVDPCDLNRAVDKDLSTICLKCLEKSATSRYESALEVADELRRYLSGEPIHARPLGPTARLWRWSRRNRLVATLAVAATVGLVGGLMTTTVAYFKTAAAYQHSEERLRKALGVVNIFFTRVSEETLLDQPGLQPLRHDLLKQAREHYVEFLKEEEGDPEIQDQLAETHYRVGRITAEIESPAAADEHYDRAITMQRALVAAYPESSAHRISLANTINAKGVALYRAGSATSIDVLRESQRLRQHLHDQTPDDVESARKLANTYMNISHILRDQKEFEASCTHLRTAQSIRLAVDKHQNDAKLLRDLAKGFYSLGAVLDQWDQLVESQDQLVEAQDNYKNAIDAFEDLSRLQSTMTDQHLRHLCLFSLAKIQEPAVAIRSYQRALDGAVPLAAANPSVDRFQEIVGSINLDTAGLYADAGESEKELESLNTAASVFRRLIVQDPVAKEHREHLIVTLQMLAMAEAPQASQQSQLSRFRMMMLDLAAEFPDITDFADAAKEASDVIAELK